MAQHVPRSRPKLTVPMIATKRTWTSATDSSVPSCPTFSLHVGCEKATSFPLPTGLNLKMWIVWNVSVSVTEGKRALLQMFDAKNCLPWHFSRFVTFTVSGLSAFCCYRCNRLQLEVGLLCFSLACVTRFIFFCLYILNLFHFCYVGWCDARVSVFTKNAKILRLASCYLRVLIVLSRISFIY